MIFNWAKLRRPGRRITELDGWRGVSILLVIIGHLINFRFRGPDAPFRNPAGTLATWGVLIFFVISGLIITRLALAECDTSGYFSAPKFYVRRFFRIVPPFFIYLLFIFLMSHWEFIDQDRDQTLRAATFTCNFLNAECGWFAGHSWSLAYEEQFYLVFPLVFAMSGKRFGGGGLYLLFGLLVVLPFVRYGFHLGWIWPVVDKFTPDFSFICAGAVVAVSDLKLRRWLSHRSADYIFSGIILALLALLLFSTRSYPLASRGAYIQAALGNTILPVALALMVAISMYRSYWFLNNPVLQFFGMISYSLYLWQEAFTAAPSLYPVNSWLCVPPIMIIAAMFSYFAIERPCAQFGRRLLLRPVAAPAERQAD